METIHSTDISRPQQAVYGFSLIAAPLLMGISTFLWENGEVGVAGGTLQMYSAVLWAMALLGMYGLLRGAMPRLAAVGSLVAIYACVGASNFGIDGIYREVYRIAGVGDISADAFRNAMGPALPLTLLTPGLFFPLSMLVLGIVLIRRKQVPVWCGALLCIGAISFPMGRIPRIEAVAHATDLLLLIPMAWIGLRYLRGESSPAPSELGLSATP